MTTPTAAIANPYWDAIAAHVVNDGYGRNIPTTSRMDEFRTPTGELDVLAWYTNVPQQIEHVRRYSWTITAPDTVAFVAAHTGPAVVDPLAGTGYCAYLLGQCGVQVAAYDANPPAVGSDANEWHRDAACWVEVAAGEATVTVKNHPEATLLLSWPPYKYAAGDILTAFPGRRVIYIGEDKYGNCADSDFFDVLDRDWVQFAVHTPVRWRGEHDIVVVYDRPA